MSDNSQYVKQAIEGGARGYITKDEISEEIVNAIRRILKGQIYITNRLIKDFPKEERDGLLAGRIQGDRT
jgi:DNA-binding NarL/FixJ family response regulator